MGLRFDPMGGGQFKQALKQIMEAESQPVKQLESRKAREEAKLKLFQDFKSKFTGVDKVLGELTSFKTFRELKVDLGDGNNLVSVTLDKERAQPGSYQIQIDSLAARSSILSNGFEDPDEKELGIGFVVMNGENGNSSEIFIDEDHASLNGVASLINAQENSPVRAAVVKDMSDAEAPWRLILTAKKEGLINQISFPEFYFLDGTKDLYIDDEKSAQNATLLMDGFPIELESNDIPDFLPGVSLHLKQARPEQPFTITVTEDHQKISGKLKALVDAVNHVLGFITQQNAIDDKTDTRTTFAGDTGLQTIEYRIRNLLHEGFIAGNPDEENLRLIFMNQLGVEFEKNGQLKFNEEKFTKALEKDFNGIAAAITGSFGFAFQLKEVLSSYTRAGDGILSLRESGLKSRVKDIDNQIDQRMKILDRRHQQLTDQFSKLEVVLSKLQSQQQYLSSTLGGGGGGSIVSQLMGG